MHELINKLKKLIALNETHQDSASYMNVKTHFEISPKEFLNYAEYDLSSSYQHHVINALSNTKRGIDCQIDSLLFGFGLYEKSKKERWDFPDKVKLLSSLNILSPNILQKINRKRNLLEHEYKNFTKEEVEDALDVANLFYAYTQKFLNNAFKEISFCNEQEEEYCEMMLNYNDNSLTVEFRKYNKGRIIQEFNRVFKSEEEDFLHFLLIFIAAYEL